MDPRLTEAGNPETTGIDRASAREIVDLINAQDRQVAPAVAAEAERIANLIDLVTEHLVRGGRLVYVGAGTSGRLGVLDAAECPPTFGTDPDMVRGIIAGGPAALVESLEGAEDDGEAARASIDGARVGRRDFVLGIAASGTTPFVQAALEEAGRRGAGIGLLSCTPPPDALASLADVVVTPLVGPEVIAGSTRMKAGSATKLVLNTLTTGVMIRLGKVYGNLMVDLQAKSLKLVDRSLRILRQLCGLDEADARRLLIAAGGSTKTAIAMHELGTSRAIAERALDECGGFLGVAIERFAGRAAPYYAGYDRVPAPEAAARLVRVLRRAPERLRVAVAKETPPARSSGRWGAREHVAHLIECEEVTFRPRVEQMLAAERPAFEDWEASAEPPIEGELAELLDRFEEERAETLRLLGGLDERSWTRRATVGEEEVTLFQLMRGVAHHDEAHAARIRESIHPALLSPTADSGQPAESGPTADSGSRAGPAAP